MKTGADRAKFCCLLLMALALAACKQGANNGNASTGGAAGGEVNAELCRKYDSCGCESYEDCMKNAARAADLDKPGVRECMLKSSCESLCLGFPDGCFKEGGGGGQQPGAGGAGGGQQRSNCTAIRCSKNSDCPSDCYGGCDGVICYSF
ncbi:MAG TPA: hypothetical protein VN256_01950 [Pyrinomonadaceae bacterium]|nr:hypothetical protein [Pyrinomonadaceae bacterium]